MAEERHQQTEEIIEKTLWIFEYSTGRYAVSIKQLYAHDEEEARCLIDNFLHKVEGIVCWERLRHVPGGFSTGSTEFLGKIHVRSDGTLVEGSYRKFIK